MRSATGFCVFLASSVALSSSSAARTGPATSSAETTSASARMSIELAGFECRSCIVVSPGHAVLFGIRDPALGHEELAEPLGHVVGQPFAVGVDGGPAQLAPRRGHAAYHRGGHEGAGEAAGTHHQRHARLVP